jgi:macrodomain Ter protein organizer (MatP/YcbG family)
MKRKPFWEMKADELADATRQFEVPFVADQARPLTRAEQDTWNRVRRKRSSPKLGQGLKRVSVSLEQRLLKRVTVLAKRRQMSRSKLIAQALEQALALEKAEKRG